MKGRNDKKHVAACHEQVVIYAKPGFVSFGLPLTEEQRAAFKHTDEAGQKYALRDLRKRGGPDKREDRLQFMVMTVGAINRFGEETENEDDAKTRAKTNVMYRGNEKTGGEKPIDLIRATLPIVIVDEPQSVEGGLNGQPAARI